MARQAFVPPAVQVGQTVIWHSDPGVPESQGTVGIVSQVSGAVISIGLVVPGSMTLLARTGVPHAEESIERINAIGEGCWRLRPIESELQEQIDALKREVGTLQGQVRVLYRKKGNPMDKPEAVNA